MIDGKYPGGEPGAQREMERGEIEERVRAAVARNQEVLSAVREGASNDEYWGALREGCASKLRVRRTDGKPDDDHGGIYLLEEQDGFVELTYFADDGRIGESFSIELDRIVHIE